jgi:hypothetical protein
MRLWEMRESEIRAWDHGFDDGWNDRLTHGAGGAPAPYEGIDYRCGWKQGNAAAAEALEITRKDEE